MFSYQALSEYKPALHHDFDHEIFLQFLKDSIDPVNENLNHWFILSAIRYFYQELNITYKKKKIVEVIEKDRIILIPNQILLNLVNFEIFLKQLRFNIKRHPIPNEAEKKQRYKLHKKNLFLLESFLAVIAHFPLEKEFKHAYEGLHKLEKQIKHKFSESIYRGIITFNAGYATTNFIMGLVGAFVLTPLTLGITGGIAVALSLIVARHHYNSNYTINDVNNALRINENKNILRVSAREYFQKRRTCLILLNNLMQNCPYGYTQSKHTNIIIKALNRSDLSIDDKLNYLMQNFPAIPQPKNKLDKLKLHFHPNIYTKVLTHKIWGPVIGFLTALPSAFGLMKLLTTVMGVSFVGLSTLGAGLAMIGVSAVVGLAIAGIQYKVINRQNKRTNRLNNFYDDKIKNIKSTVFQLDRIKCDLTLFASMLKVERKTMQPPEEKVDVTLTVTDKLKDDYASLSKLSFINQSKIVPIPKLEEKQPSLRINNLI